MVIPVGFDKSLALFLADCCFQAYNQFSFKGTFSVPVGYTLVDSIVAAPVKTLDFYGFIIESSDSIVISFRGSRSNPDWIADATIIQTYFPYTRIKLGIHSGFATIYKACRQQIMNTLGDMDSSKQLFITGHSLGGALAVLCALDAAVNTAYNNPVMYNFGSPRVGNSTFVQAYNEVIDHSVRIVNTNDIVPLLPPAVVHPPLSNELLYYRHVKDLLTITAQTGSILGNHLVENYMERIRAM
ncbi:MAG: lipase family protein [Clostridia bacterium]